jgi:hypothetical protein
MLRSLKEHSDNQCRSKNPCEMILFFTLELYRLLLVIFIAVIFTNDNVKSISVSMMHSLHT